MVFLPWGIRNGMVAFSFPFLFSAPGSVPLAVAFCTTCPNQEARARRSPNLKPASHSEAWSRQEEQVVHYETAPGPATCQYSLLNPPFPLTKTPTKLC